ncbi:hypothetical protein H4R27_001388 [Coemansia aciculifera]|nr:hypothetical protein H4R27_001388 [Coemansia aciculifera]
MLHPKFAIPFALVAAIGHASATPDDNGVSTSADVNAIASLLSADFSNEITRISSLWTDADFMSSLSSVLSDDDELWASIQATIDAVTGSDVNTDTDTDTDSSDSSNASYIKTNTGVLVAGAIVCVAALF